MAMVKVASLKRDRKRILAGDWITYPFWKNDKGETPVRFKVSGASIEAFTLAQEEQSAKYLKVYPSGQVPSDVRYEDNARMICDHLLHEWEGLDVEYSPETAEQMLPDREYEEITDAVWWCARRIEIVTAQFVEDGIKNSAPPSATS